VETARAAEASVREQVRVTDLVWAGGRVAGVGYRARDGRRGSGSTDHPSYFRRSTGPGWALPGDSGHFKDPITAQGIRDALRFGRLLGEALDDVDLGDPAALDSALAAWETRRDGECLETYTWTSQVARADPVSPLDVASYRYFSHPDRAHELLDLHSRVLRPSEVLTPRRAILVAARALRMPGRRATLSRIVRDIRS